MKIRLPHKHLIRKSVVNYNIKNAQQMSEVPEKHIWNPRFIRRGVRVMVFKRHQYFSYITVVSFISGE
jgi:hypothetical protein